MLNYEIPVMCARCDQQVATVELTVPRSRVLTLCEQCDPKEQGDLVEAESQSH